MCDRARVDPAQERAIRTRQKLLWIALGLALASELLAFAGISGGVHAEIPAYLKQGNYFLSACLLAGAVVYLASGPSAQSKKIVIGVGIALELAHAAARNDRLTYLSNAGAMFGLTALAVAAWEWSLAKGDDKRHALLRLLETAIFPAFLVVARLPVELTVILHPISLDAQFLHVDQTVFGGQPSWVVGRLFQRNDIIRLGETLLYIEMPVAAAYVYILERRKAGAKRPKMDVQIAFLITGVVGVVLYQLCAVAGPRPAFEKFFPFAIPKPDIVEHVPYLAGTRFRNAIPSLHTTWALLVYWHARKHGVGPRIFGAVWVVLTIVAMLGLGEHWLVDVAISVPFAVAIRAAMATSIPLKERVRWLPIAAGAFLYLAWIIAVRFPYAVLEDTFIFRTLAVIALAPLLLEVRLHAAEVARPAEDITRDEAALVPAPAPTSRLAMLVATIFFASGFAGLVYEVVFAKELALVFGSTAIASSTVLATYMGGMALGSYVGGRVKSKAPLRTYGLCEVGVGVACALAPLLVKAIKGAYIGIASGGDPSRPSLVALQVALGAAVLLPPTVLMGMTLPILGRTFTKDDPTLGRSVGLLYAANTFGAGAGALLTGYLLLPTLGVFMTTMVGVVANLGVGLAAMRLDAVRQKEAPAAKTAVTVEEEENVVVLPEEERKRLALVGFGVLFVGGIITLGLEVTYTHLLAVVVGNSSFAFSSMLVAFLIGLASGASYGRSWLRRGRAAMTGVGVAQAGLVITVLLGVFAWNYVPSYLAMYAGFGPARTFAVSEFIRFVICCLLLIPPAFCIGASYPLAVECVVKQTAGGGDRIRALGNGAAANTVGNITGALVTSFVLMPSLGSLRTLHLLMGGTVLLAGAAFVFSEGRQRIIVGSTLGVALLLGFLQPASFDLTKMASGANVYFVMQQYGRVIDHVESTDGGLTTVALSHDRDGRAVKTMLTNGKFQGDDSPEREMQAQYAITLIPLLHTTQRANALVVGLGTGVSARVVHDAGFAQVDVAELSRDMITIAKRHFGSVNGDVLDRPNVKTFVTDGRNYLMLEPKKYDLIGLEISSIWFAGAASLYNQEFYQLVKGRLTEKGVLQQWIQLHHVDQLDLVTMLASARSVFDRVWVYSAGNQGIVIACDHDCRPGKEMLDRMDTQPSLVSGLKLLGGRAANLLVYRILTPQGVDALLTEAGASPKDPSQLAQLVSTDDNLFLEYHTPRGNMRPYGPTLQENTKALKRFAPPSPFEATHLRPGKPEAPLGGDGGAPPADDAGAASTNDAAAGASDASAASTDAGVRDVAPRDAATD